MLFPAGGRDLDLFGSAIGATGDTAAVGAPGRRNQSDTNDGHYGDGAVYLFRRGPGGWSAAGVIEPPTGLVASWFGRALALEDDTLVVGAPSADGVEDGESGGIRDEAGAVYVYSGAFDQPPAKLAPTDPANFSRFGAALDLDGDTLIAAAATAGPEVLTGANTKPWLNAPAHGVVLAFSPPPPGSHWAYLPLSARSALETTTDLIAYSKAVDGGASDIFLVTADGRGRTNLTRSPVDELEPAWSPDGRRLAFIRDRRELVILDIASSVNTIITPPVTGPIYNPAWSPDGRLIAYHGFPDYYADIFVVAADGGGSVNLTQTAQRSEEYPTWSPDGAHLAFVDDSVLSTMKSDGSDVVPVSGALIGALSPDWSPDGTTILYHRLYDAGDLYTIPAGGGASRLLLKNGQEARWSPDGAQIVFTGAGWGIFRINADGSGLAAVDPSRFAHMPDWQPE